MKYIKIFEEYDEKVSNRLLGEVKAYLKQSTFKELPIEYQKSIVIRHFEIDGDMGWDENLVNYIEKNHKNDNKWMKNDEFVEKLIDNYSSVHGGKAFIYGKIPMEKLTSLLMSSEELSDHDDFETYHNWYGANDVSGDAGIHPIIMMEDDSMSYIEDGWHRLHRYYDQEVEEVPVIMYQ